MSYKIMLKIKSLDQDSVTFYLPQGAAFKEKLVKLLKQGFERGMICDFAVNKPRRTTGDGSQNHHLNGHIVQIMRELGMTTKKEYDQVKTEIKRIAHFAFGYPALDAKCHFFKSEADCNTTECAWLIEAAHMLAADLNIVLIETF